MMRTYLVAVLVAALATMTGPARADITIVVPDVTLQPNQAGQTIPIYIQENLASGVDQVPGLDFKVQINTFSGSRPNLASVTGQNPGGPTPVNGPAIAGMDIVGSGTLFNPNNNGPRLLVPFSAPTNTLPVHLAEAVTLTANGYIGVPNGTTLLGTITVDTTGILAGATAQYWTFRMGGLPAQTNTGADARLAGLGNTDFTGGGPTPFFNYTGTSGVVGLTPGVSVLEIAADPTNNGIISPEPSTAILALLALGLLGWRRPRSYKTKR